MSEFRKWRDKEKLTVPDFVRKAGERGVNTRHSTAYKWVQGQKPRGPRAEDLKKAFPSIRFGI